MDYEKKYKDALERARQFSEKPYLEDSKGIVDYIFPELKESEDERIIDRIIHALHGDVLEMSEIKEAITWLNSFKDRYTWKPSEVQIKVLDEVIRNPHLSTDEYNGLIALKEQLKTQKGESV